MIYRNDGNTSTEPVPNVFSLDFAQANETKSPNFGERREIWQQNSFHFNANNRKRIEIGIDLFIFSTKKEITNIYICVAILSTKIDKKCRTRVKSERVCQFERGIVTCNSIR